MKRPDKKPTKGDLRWSANWAQNADNILFIHRPLLYESTTEPAQDDGELAADHRTRVTAWREKRERITPLAYLLVDKVRNGRPSFAINPAVRRLDRHEFSEDPGQAA